MASMQAHLTDALNAGYLGLSIQTLPWDKLDGDDLEVDHCLRILLGGQNIGN